MSELPANWVQASVRELVLFSPKNHCADDTVVGFVPLQLLGVTYRSQHQYLPRPWREVKTGYSHFATGDVLLARITPSFENGKAGIVRELPNGLGAGSTEYFVFRPIDGVLDRRILLAHFKMAGFLINGEAVMSGAVGQQRVPKEYVLASTVRLPPYAEQKRIADKLDSLLSRVDACRERLDRVPAILKRFRQAVLAAATSGELTREWRESCQLNLEPWESLSMAQILDGKPRNGYSPRAVDQPTKVRSLTLTATTTGRFRGEYFKYIDEDIPSDSHLWLQPGDILVQRANTIEYVGVSAIYDGPAFGYIYPDLMMKCRANGRVRPTYLHLMLSSEPVRKYFREHATGTAGNMPKINQQTVMEAPACLPPLLEQDEIVRRAEVLFCLLDQLTARHETALARVQRITPSLLSKAFRGELVPQDPNDEPASELLARIRAAGGVAESKKPGRGRAKASRT